MDVDDRLSITTPEGVTVDLILAGAGSRGIAQLVDAVVQAILWIAVIAIVSNTSDGGLMNPADDESFFVAVAIASLLIFAVNFFYDVLFETLGSGRTPGKRMMGLRVVRTGGGPVGFLSSAIRNLVRIVDILPGVYLVGLVAIVVSPKNQRLGDLAGGTLVVRERTEVHDMTSAASWPPVNAPTAIDVSTVTAEDLAVVRRFLERRTSLEAGPRMRLAQDLAERLAPKVAGAEPFPDPERFLEQVAAAKAARG